MIKKIKLERFAYTPYGTFGNIKVEGFEGFTVERPWLGNKKDISCIPEDCYLMTLGRYNKGNYDAYEILDVPSRSDIKIHIGNTSDDVMGCVSIGYRLGYLNNKWAVIDSRLAFIDFMIAMDGCKDALINVCQKSTFTHE